MVVVIPFAFDGKEQDKHLRLAQLCVRALRWVQPPVEIVQLADANTRAIEGADAVYRVDARPFGVWMFEALTQVPAEQYLRLDYDCVIQSSVEDVFEQDFDVAFPRESDAGHMNAGVIFVKNRDFFRDAMHIYLTKTRKDNWQDIQKAMKLSCEELGFNVLKLDPDVYNFFPGHDDTEFPATAKILHFKGSRKQHMHTAIEKRIAVEDALKTGTWHKRDVLGPLAGAEA